MDTKAIKILVAFAAGQAVQVIAHTVCLNFNMWANRQIPFCLGAGFIVFFAVICGVIIATPKPTEHAHEKKTYLDWAEIPEKESEVINPFDAVKK